MSQTPSPAPANPTTPVAAAPKAPGGPVVRRVPKGQLLFSEGDTSRAMYLLKAGMVRVFKKKGDSAIEIDTIHTGSVVGELAFLDGLPRSASAEALTDCEVVEISGATFQAVLANMPDWLKILLRTVVGRLRTASTRIRQLETASTSYVSEKDGKRSAQYAYLPVHDTMRILSAVLLVAARNGQPGPSGGSTLRMGLLQRYCNQVMGVPVAKMATLLEVLRELGLLQAVKTDEGEQTVVKDLDAIERLIAYLNEENLLEPAKRHDLSLRGFQIMGLIARHIHLYPVDAQTGLSQINIAEIKKKETGLDQKEPFRYDEFPELVRLGYATQIGIKSADEAFTQVRAEDFLRAYRNQRFVMAVQRVNEAKR
jgi:CRP-like cAMP-binding protein